MLFIIFDWIARIVIEGDQILQVLGDISLPLLVQRIIPIENILIAFEFLETEDRNHDLTQKLQVVSAVALKVEIFREPIFAAFIEANVCKPLFDQEI